MSSLCELFYHAELKKKFTNKLNTNFKLKLTFLKIFLHAWQKSRRTDACNRYRLEPRISASEGFV